MTTAMATMRTGTGYSVGAHGTARRWANLRWACGVLVIGLVAVPDRPADAQTFTEEARFVKPSPEADVVKAAVALDGDTAVVPAEEQFTNPASRPGAAFVYRKSGGQWALEQRLTASTPQHSDNFGGDVDLQGNTLVVGASALCNSGNGRFHVFERTGTTWTLLRTYSGPTADQCLGTSVAVSGDTIIASAPNLVSPSIHVARRTGTVWGDVERISPPGGASRFSFGQNVDLSGDTICATSRSATNTLQVDVFTRSGAGTWTLQQAIVPPTTDNSSSAAACTLDGDSMVVGAAAHDTSASPTGQDVGIAYVYVRSAGAWTLQQTLPGPGTAGAQFGQSVSLLGDEAVVAAAGQQVAFVYRRAGGSWTLAQQIAKVTQNPNSTPTRVGVSVAASGLAVGQQGYSAGVYGRSSAPTVPGAPTNFSATASGNTINMAWGAPSSGTAATSYTLVARTAPGAAPLTTVPVGNVTSFAVTGPNGTFILSVRGSNAQGDGPESNSVTVTLPGGGVALPAPPTGFGAAVSGTTATFTWTAPVSGGAPTGYVLVAGLTPGFTSSVAQLPVPASPLSYAVPDIPAGTYYVRLLSSNAGGTSGPSNEVEVTVAGAAAPGAPVLNTPSVSGSTVGLSWTPGPGGTPTGYTLIATQTPGGSPIASIPVTGTSVSVPGVPSGTYYVRLTASNAGGTSAPSNQVTLTVP